MSTSDVPITAGGAATDYSRAFKKHFGDRPTAFALSESSRPSSAASIASSVQPMVDPACIFDPFAASSSTLSSAANGPRQQAAVQSSAHGVVDVETHNQLQNLGYRIRSRINQGYNRTQTSLDPFGSNHSTDLMRSEREILTNVTNTRRAWSRVQSAPSSGAADFNALRSSLNTEDMDTDMAEAMTKQTNQDYAAKRSRDDDDSDSEVSDRPTLQATPNERRIARLPTLSFSSSISSSTSSVFEPSASLQPTTSRTFARTHSSAHSPFPPSQVVDATDAQMDFDPAPHDKLRPHSGYDFSSHFNSTDF